MEEKIGREGEKNKNCFEKKGGRNRRKVYFSPLFIAVAVWLICFFPPPSLLPPPILSHLFGPLLEGVGGNKVG